MEWASSYEKSAPLAWISYAYGHWGSMHLDLREYDDAINCLEKQISISESFNFMPSIIRLFQTSLMRAQILRHDQNIEINELFILYQANKLLWNKGWMARNIGDILLNIDGNHLADAKVWFQKAIKEDAKNGYRWQLAMDHACYADWFKKKGDIQGAKEQLTKSIDLFRECGADGWVEKYEKELALI